VLNKSTLHNRPIYVHPILYSNRNLCWEATAFALPVAWQSRTHAGKKRVRLEDQVCTTCEMRAYAAAVVVELPKNHTEQAVAELGELIDLANRYLLAAVQG